MLENTITEVMENLESSTNDVAIRAVMAKLEKLRLLTAGHDRATVCWALVECRELLTAGGRLRRAAAAAASERRVMVDSLM
jgi:hypothetical protein